MSKLDHGRGKIRDKAHAAIVTSKIYQPKKVRPKIGKDSVYNRKEKHKSREISRL